MDRVDSLEQDFQDLKERLAVFERIKDVVLMILKHGMEALKSIITIASLTLALTGHLPIEQAADLLRAVAGLWGG